MRIPSNSFSKLSPQQNESIFYIVTMLMKSLYLEIMLRCPEDKFKRFWMIEYFFDIVKILIHSILEPENFRVNLYNIFLP